MYEYKLVTKKGISFYFVKPSNVYYLCKSKEDAEVVVTNAGLNAIALNDCNIDDFLENIKASGNSKDFTYLLDSTKQGAAMKKEIFEKAKESMTCVFCNSEDMSTFKNIREWMKHEKENEKESC
jgi:hypothetical protein